MLSMINLEMEQIENIQKELNQGAIDLNDIENRFVSLYQKCSTISYVFCQGWKKKTRSQNHYLMMNCPKLQPQKHIIQDYHFLQDNQIQMDYVMSFMSNICKKNS